MLVAGVVVVLIAGFVASVLFAAETMLRSSDVYKMSLARAQASPCVIRKLGEPIVAKGMVSGNISETNQEGTADMEIPLQGSHGKGNLEISAKRSAGVWDITSLSLMHESGQLHLLPTPSPCD